MGKFAKEVLTVATIAVAVVASGGLAIPTFIAGATTTYAASVVAATAFWSAITLGSSALMQALAPKPTRQQMENRVQFRSSMASRKIIYGRAASGGLLVWAHSHGTDNEWLTLVHAHSVGECEALVKMVVGGDDVTFDGSGDAIGDYNGFIKCFFHGGTDTQAADSNIVGLGSWTANHQLKGICYTVSQFKFNRKKFPNGLPSFYHIIDGRKIYDPRLDTTQTDISGSGSHRENDPTTWEFSANPALAWRDYKSDDTYGCVIPSARINIEELAASANVCDETVTHKDLSTGDRYSMGGVIDTGSRKADNVSAILSAMGGFEVYTGGTFIIKAAAWDTPTITLTEDDLRGPARLTTKQSRQDRFNSVRGQYLDGDDFAVTDFPPLQNTTYQTDDGEPLWQDISFPLTKDHRDAQRLAKIMLEKSRREIVLNWPGKLLGYQLRAGDTVMVDYDRFSYSAKTFRVMEWALAPDGGVDMVLKEEDSTCYSWTAATDEADQQAGGTVTVRDPSTAHDPTGLILAATTTTGTDGETIPAISVTWTADNSPFIERMLIEYKKTTDTVYQRLEGAAASDGSALIPNLMSGTTYDVRLTYISTTGVSSDTPATGSQATGGTYAGGSVDWDNVGDANGNKPDDFANNSGTTSVITDPKFTRTYNGGSELWGTQYFWTRGEPGTSEVHLGQYYGEFGVDPTTVDLGLRMKGDASSNTYIRQAETMPCKVGDKFRCRARIKIDATFFSANTADTDFRIELIELDSGGSGTQWNDFVHRNTSGAFTSDTWVTVEGVAEVTDTTTKEARVQAMVGSGASTGYVFIDQIEVWKVPAGTENTDQDWADITGTGKPEDNATAGADDTNITGTVGATADILNRVSTSDNAYTAQHIIAENTETAQVPDTTFVKVKNIHLTRAGAVRIGLQLKNEANPTHSTLPGYYIKQGATTVLATQTHDGGNTYVWYYHVLSGLDPDDGPLEIWIRGGYKSGLDKWSRLQGTRIMTDKPLVDYITPSATEYPEITY